MKFLRMSLSAAVVLVSVSGLTACGGNKKTDLASLKKTEEFKACTVNKDGQYCLDKVKATCKDDLYQTLKTKIKALPSGEKGPQLCESSINISAAMSEASVESIAPGGQQHPAGQGGATPSTPQKEIDAAKTWFQKVKKTVPNYEQCLSTNTKEKEGFCLTFSTGCTKDISNKLLAEYKDPKQFAPSPCAFPNGLTLGVDRGFYSKTAVKAFSYMVVDATQDVSEVVPTIKRITKQMVKQKGEFQLTQNDKKLLKNLDAKVTVYLTKSHELMSQLNSGRADERGAKLGLEIVQKSIKLLQDSLAIITSADELVASKNAYLKKINDLNYPPSQLQSMKKKLIAKINTYKESIRKLKEDRLKLSSTSKTSDAG